MTIRRWIPALLPLLHPSMLVLAQVAPPPVSLVVKSFLGPAMASGPNLLEPQGWRPYGRGFERKGDSLVCDNGDETSARRGASQTIVLNQARPEPIIATVLSRAEGVSGRPDADYSLYIDLVYDDDTPLWGQTSAFKTGTHESQAARVVIVPERPVKRLSLNLLLRNHAGRAIFTAPELRIVRSPEEGMIFDGLPIVQRGRVEDGFQARDVEASSDFVRLERVALGLTLEVTSTPLTPTATGFDLTLRDTTGRDRAVALLYAVQVSPEGLRWLDDPRRGVTVEPRREYSRTTRFRAGSNGRCSIYPIGAVASASAGVALGLDPNHPAFSRFFYNSGTGELCLAFDLALTPERPAARLRFIRFSFDPTWGFRAAWSAYMGLYPEAFCVRVSRQGVWMPFAPISRVSGWEDFGFAFKEGDGETRFDDDHSILTFRYTEPMTWWMPMPEGMPRTIEAARLEAQRLADAGKPEAQAFGASAFHDADGTPPARMIDTPWNDGAVWSINSMPGISGQVTDFNRKWNPELRERLYGPDRKADLDGEYVDSSEGYVTDELDFRREHFTAARTPLVFDTETCRPAIFRGLIAAEYVRALADDVHGMNRLMMANSTPSRSPWLAPHLDIMGTETDWNPPDAWRPMSDAELLYRRTLCGAKPFCFLMNTDFDRFDSDLTERFMKRCLAYGMFPGFFSANASEGHYFSRPELYNRDRLLFKKYVPLCRLVAEAGWQPITRASTNDARVHIERFGPTKPDGPAYFTIFNDSSERRTVSVTLEGGDTSAVLNLMRDEAVSLSGHSTSLTVDSEDVILLELLP